MEKLEIPAAEISLFDFIGLIAEKMKGHHFCSLSMMNTGHFFKDGVTIVPVEYQPVPGDTEIRLADNRLTFFEAPARVEHFLSSVREHFPGISFQELTIKYIPYLSVGI